MRTHGLLLGLLVMFVVLPLLGPDRAFVSRLVFIGIFLLGVLSVSEHRRQVILGICLMAPAILMSLYGLFLGENEAIKIVTLTTYSVALAFLVFVMVRRLLRAQFATAETLSTAASGYVLIGVLWACLYAILMRVEPNCIQGLKGAATPVDAFYFSFVTMTTLGYGDMAPVTAAARSAATLEAVVSQLYLAIAIARLVGLHIAAGMSKDVSSS